MVFPRQPFSLNIGPNPFGNLGTGILDNYFFVLSKHQDSRLIPIADLCGSGKSRGPFDSVLPKTCFLIFLDTSGVRRQKFHASSIFNGLFYFLKRIPSINLRPPEKKWPPYCPIDMITLPSSSAPKRDIFKVAGLSAPLRARVGAPSESSCATSAILLPAVAMTQPMSV